MIRKIDKYNQAILLRQNGLSIRSIAQQLNISSSTASLWCRSVQLTSEQLLKLRAKSINIDMLKQLAIKKHLAKIEAHQDLFLKSKQEIIPLSPQEFFVSGLALYWAEGFKNLSEGRIGFCNTDPRMIVFMLAWFRKFFKLQNTDFTLRAEFNIEHIDRRTDIETYWSRLTKIPLNQFNSPFLQKSKWLKQYKNRNSYYGTLRIRVKKSTALLPRIRGWIEGLSQSFNE
jgi:transcriptional regulator with XRE-family HTH domain